jgi:cyclopropane-fatty-acyl-phospholipid synthase
MSARNALLRLFEERLDDVRIEVRCNPHTFTLGRGVDTVAAIRVHDERFFDRVLGYGNLGMGEAFIDGDFTVEQGTLTGFLTALLRNRVGEGFERRPALVLRALAVRVRNLFAGAPRSVRAHYDLGPDLFESFLDSTLTYSCGYAVSEADTLEQLQQQKLERICRKLRLNETSRLLDIGCGFGGLLLHAARRFGVRGIGVTLSHDQYRIASERIAAAGLSDRIEIRLADFAEIPGPFNRVVSVGMIEHLRIARYGAYFRYIANVLDRDGIGLVHGIARTTERNVQDPFIQKYIFPRSNTPSLSEVARPLERNGLAIVDVDNVGPHYAPTLRAWRDRFLGNRHTLEPARYDLAFQRMWEYYLSCGVAAAEASDAAVYQVLFTNDYPSPRWARRV